MDKLNTIEQEKETFKINDLESANWCFKKIKILKKELFEKEFFAQNEIEKMKNYIKNEKEIIESSIQYFENLIKMYVEERLEENPKFKLSLPEGTASFGKEQIKIHYDDDQMLEFVKNNKMDNFITKNITEKLNKKEFNNFLKVTEDGQVVTEDGEIIENAYIEKFRNFNLKVKGE